MPGLASSSAPEIFRQTYDTYRSLVEKGLTRFLPASTARPQRLHEAMNYSLLAGGKRLRPVLLLATADWFGDSLQALPAAVAVECVHTFSLIHDDLPCMDDDDLRRGQPTCHRQFDEATALLAGDALLAYAFGLLGRHYRDPAELGLALIDELSAACGNQGLVGGQMEDILAEQQPVNPEQLEFIHTHKTAALIEKSVVMGGLIGGANPSEIAHLRTAGQALGLAFQIIDDVLDATADAATLGKTPGKDAASGKATYVALYGLEEARRQAARQSARAQETLQNIRGGSNFFHDLVEAFARRLN